MADETLTPEQIETWRHRIDAMAQEDLARLWRFSPIGHPVFCTPVLYAHFQERFRGMTPAVSKAIGW